MNRSDWLLLLGGLCLAGAASWIYAPAGLALIGVGLLIVGYLDGFATSGREPS